MGTRLISPRQNGADISVLTTNQQKFVLEMMANDAFNSTVAARAAGYKNPSQAANKLMNNKVVMRVLGKAMRERNERLELKADDVLEYLRTALFFNPLKLFSKTEEGCWMVEDLDEIPNSIGMLVEEVEMKTVETEEGTKSFFKLKFVAHSKALELALKHTVTQKSEVKVTADWDQLLSPARAQIKSDPIKQAILDASSEEVQE